MSKTSDLIKKSHAKRGAPGTLKRKVKGKMTLAKARALKNKPGATTMDKKQANFFINMHTEDAAAVNTGSIQNPATTVMGKRPKEINVTDRRRKKNKLPVLLKRFRKHMEENG